MTQINIDPTNGPHAAAELSDEALEYLSKVVALEFALRTDAEYFRDKLVALAEARSAMQDTIDQVRHERDLMRFAAQVMADLEQLPVVEEPEPRFGMYL